MPATEECIWSREGCYNWKETYALALKYSQFFLSLNVQSQDIVGFYLTNKPEYMFAELGCWAVGAAVRKAEGNARYLKPTDFPTASHDQLPPDRRCPCPLRQGRRNQATDRRLG